MGRFGSSRFTRVEADPGVLELTNNNARCIEHEIDEQKVDETSLQNGSTKQMGKSLKEKVLSRVFSEDYGEQNKILDPRGHIIQKWTKTFLAACLLSLFVDPIFFYVPIIREELCIDISGTLRTVLTVIRSVTDVFYVIQIFVRFHTAYVTPCSHVVGRGELVIDSSKIALRYIKKGFLIDLIAALPIPQVLVWITIPNLEGWGVFHSENVLWFMIIIQYLAKLYLVFPFSSEIVEATGVVTKTALAAAAYNYLIFFLAGHVFGAAWYILSIQRQEDCWHWACNNEISSCPQAFFDCRSVEDPSRVNWFQSSNITYQCNPNNKLFPYGILASAVTYSVQGISFYNKFFYCLWWGLQNMSTLGQSFFTSTFVGENVYSCIIIIVGLILLAMLIGNVQRYLFSTTKRLEEWKIQRADTEHWMRHRELPASLRLSVRKYEEYRWLTAQGVDEEAIISSLPVHLRRKIKRHLCFDLLRRVPLIDEMDETMLDAICERLEPALCNQGMFLVREGDPVHQMFFIIRGHLDSYNTDVARTRFLNLCRVGPGDFCGEELLTWALDPSHSVTLPLSTRTFKAINEVEAFALSADDLKFVSAQFRELHSKKLRHKFRFYSLQWRTWAACTIQDAWRQYKMLKNMPRINEPGMPAPGSFWSNYAENLVAKTRLNATYKQSESDGNTVNSLEKPEDPDFSDDD